MNRYITKIKSILLLCYEKIKELDITLKISNYKLPIIMCSICAVLIIGGIYTYVHRDKSDIKVCESKIDYNKGIGLTFYVGKDGETIDKIEKVDTVSLEFIEKNISEENAAEILDEYKSNAKFLYKQTEKYKDVSWFKANIHEEENLLRTTYTFDVSSKDFDYDKYKSLIEEFSLEYYYDKAKGKFIYDEEKFLSPNTPLGNIEEIGCHSQNVRVEKAGKLE